MTASELKARLRRVMRERLRQVTAVERQAASAAVASLLLSSQGWQAAQAVMLYAALPGELDLGPVMQAALQAGKQVALPAYDARRQIYVPRLVRHLETDLAPGPYGVHEPQREAKEFSLKLLDLVVVPALGFNEDGVRLGRGAGHYDRMLAGFTGPKWGVGYEWQMDLDFAGEPHDARMDALIGPTGWRVCPSRKNQ